MDPGLGAVRGAMSSASGITERWDIYEAQEHWHAARGLQPRPCSLSGGCLRLTVTSASCLSPEPS